MELCFGIQHYAGKVEATELVLNPNVVNNPTLLFLKLLSDFLSLP